MAQIQKNGDLDEQMKREQQNLNNKKIKNNRVGNGGFSLRSKKFLKFSEQFQRLQWFG